MRIVIGHLISILILISTLPLVSSQETSHDLVNPAFYVMNISPTRVAPGETSTLNATIKNLGTRFASRIEVMIDPEDLSPIDPIGAGNLQIGTAEKAQFTRFFGIVEQSEEINLVFDFHVDQSAEERVYFIPLVLSWGERYTQTLQPGILIKRSEAEFQLLESSPELLTSGGSGDLKIKIINFGDNYAHDLRASIDPTDTSPLDPIGRTTLLFEGKKIQSGEELELQFPVNIKHNSPEGVYNIPLNLEWEDNTAIDKNQTINIGLFVKRPHSSIEVTHQVPASIKPGEGFDLGLTVKNTGDPLYHMDAFIEIEGESLMSKGPDNFHIDELSVGESKSFELNFISDKGLTTGLYSIPITLKYEGVDGNPREQTENVPVEVKGLAKLSIASLKIDPQNPRKGDEVTIELRIENVGDDDSENTKLVLDSDLEGFKTAYLGELERDDDTPAIFTLRADSPGELINTLTLTYEDDFGEHTISEEIRFTVYDSQTKNIRRIFPFVFGVIASVGIYKLKKRKG